MNYVKVLKWEKFQLKKKITKRFELNNKYYLFESSSVNCVWIAISNWMCE